MSPVSSQALAVSRPVIKVLVVVNVLYALAIAALLVTSATDGSGRLGR